MVTTVGDENGGPKELESRREKLALLKPNVGAGFRGEIMPRGLL